jgi:hypothetical protein
MIERERNFAWWFDWREGGVVWRLVLVFAFAFAFYGIPRLRVRIV